MLRLHRLKNYPPLREAYEDLARRVYGLRQYHVYRAVEVKGTKAIRKELCTFRGAGRLDVWAYDPRSESISSMNLLRLVSGTRFRFIPGVQARKLTEQLGVPFYPPALGLYVEILNYLDERSQVHIDYRYALVDNTAPLNLAVDRAGFYLEAPVPEIGVINRKLEGQWLCTCVVQESPQTLRRRFALPPMFEIYLVRDETGTEYGVAFGQDALLLDSILHWRSSNEVSIV